MTQEKYSGHVFWLFLITIIELVTQQSHVRADQQDLGHAEFSTPSEVMIRKLPVGANSTPISTEEPFLTRDCRFLFFNTHERENSRDLHFAEWDGDEWIYRGELGPNVNTEDEVEGNPTMDKEDNFYFIDSKLESMVSVCKFNKSSRSLENCREFDAVPEKEVHLFGQRIFGTMGVEVSVDSNVLFFDRAIWTLRGIWLGHVIASDIHFVEKQNQDWIYNRPRAEKLMATINSSHIEYAESLSPDLKEIFFVRLDPEDIDPKRLKSKIMYSFRRSVHEPFGVPTTLHAIGDQDFVEAPAISCNGLELYYHKRIPRLNKFKIFKVVRKQVPDY